MTNDVIADMVIFGDQEVVQTTAIVHFADLNSFPALKKEADHIKACRVMTLTSYPDSLAIVHSIMAKVTIIATTLRSALGKTPILEMASLSCQHRDCKTL